METDFFFIALGGYLVMKIMQRFRFMFGSGGGLVEVEAGHGGS